MPKGTGIIISGKCGAGGRITPDTESECARFVSEFGFQAPANRQDHGAVMRPADRSPQSAVMEHHNKQVEGPERLFRFHGSAHYAVPRTGSRLHLYRTTCAGGSAAVRVEHWRRQKFRTAGVLFWQLNDCWPVTSWAVIDSELRPKAAYTLRRAVLCPGPRCVR